MSSEPDANAEETLRPIAAPEHIAKNVKAATGDFFSRCVFFLAVIVALVAIIMSAVAFAGFAENDQNITHLISAFGLCFGTGALAYGPMALIALYARAAMHQPMTRFRAIVVVLLMIPWLVLAGLIFGLEDNWRIIAAMAAMIAIFISAWAFRYFKAH